MKYFSYNKSYEENRKFFLSLCNCHHPDKPTGNEDLMKEINSEWELYAKRNNSNILNKTEDGITEWDIINAFATALFNEEEEEIEEEYVMFKGRKYIIDENIIETIALRYGGLGVIEFLNSPEWKDRLNNK